MSDLLNLARRITGDAAAQAVLLSSRSDRVVIRVSPVVVKAHAAGTCARELRARLALLGNEAMRGIFLAPWDTRVWPVSGPLLATLWPVGFPMENDLSAAPWDAAARLLAQLHRVPVPASSPGDALPRCRAAEKFRSAIMQLERAYRERPDPASHTVLTAAGMLDLTEASPAEAMTLVHGDWHFGQVVSAFESGEKSWRLIDPDDMGLGNPAWDLARPAAFFAAGLLPPAVWESFLNSYRAAGGPAVPPSGDPWTRLEKPARALVIQCAAAALLRSQRFKRPVAEAEQALIDACQRMTRMP